MKRVYMAGPLFTYAEVMFNFALRSHLLRIEKMDIWLPQEKCDGILDPTEIAASCTQGVKTSDLILVNCDGADVDSGTAFEAGLARGLNKYIIAYRTDFRRSGDCDENMNLMLAKSANSLVTIVPGASLEVLAHKLHCEMCRYVS